MASNTNANVAHGRRQKYLTQTNLPMGDGADLHNIEGALSDDGGEIGMA